MAYVWRYRLSSTLVVSNNVQIFVYLFDEVTRFIVRLLGTRGRITCAKPLQFLFNVHTVNIPKNHFIFVKIWISFRTDRCNIEHIL